ncbi:hypothetical protein FV113G1_22420 [Fusobacterium varium]|nr:hypothetical protein FV113G1_22420 [Fusobacterium varium]
MELKIFLVLFFSILTGTILGTIAKFYYYFKLYNLSLNNFQKLNFIYNNISIEYLKKYFLNKNAVNNIVNKKIKSISNEFINYEEKNIKINNIKNIAVISGILSISNFTLYIDKDKIEMKQYTEECFPKNEELNISKTGYLAENEIEVEKWIYVS